MGGCLYRNNHDQYNYTIDDIILRQQLTRTRIDTLNKYLEDQQQREQRYQKNIEEGEKLKQTKKLNQSSIDKSGYDLSLSKNNQMMQNIEEAEDESSFIETQKQTQTERNYKDEEPILEDPELLQLASTDQLINKPNDNIRDQLQGRESNEMDEEILQYFNKTKQDYN